MNATKRKGEYQEQLNRQQHATDATHDWDRQPVEMDASQGVYVAKTSSEVCECIVCHEDRLYHLEEVDGVYEALNRHAVIWECPVIEIWGVCLVRGGTTKPSPYTIEWSEFRKAPNGADIR